MQRRVPFLTAQQGSQAVTVKITEMDQKKKKKNQFYVTVKPIAEVFH